jgi:hypothetical protein
VFEDAFLLDTEQWEWTSVPLAREQQLQQQQDQKGEQEQQGEQQQEHQQATTAGLLKGGVLHPPPGFLVGHTASLAERGEGAGLFMGGKEGRKEARVLVFGGQDRLGVRREDLLALKG